LRCGSAPDLAAPPLITARYPDKTSLPLVRKWAGQLRTDFAEVLGYTLVSTGETIRLRRAQDTLDPTRPTLTRAKRPFDRRRYVYLVLTLSALGRAGSQIALSELADAVAAEAGRIDSLGMDTGRKADRDAFVDAVAWLEARGALRMVDGSAAEWVNDPERAEALYDIDREVVAAVYAPSRVLQHLSSVTELLSGTDRGPGAWSASPGTCRTTGPRRSKPRCRPPACWMGGSPWRPTRSRPTTASSCPGPRCRAPASRTSSNQRTKPRCRTAGSSRFSPRSRWTASCSPRLL
jgi:Protein of unknown function (DUF2398)